MALVPPRAPPRRRADPLIVCLRTVGVPADVRDRYLAWIAEGRAVREAHGILAELVLEPSDGDGDTVVITVWPDHETFDAWIATPERDALTASAVHQAVDYQPDHPLRRRRRLPQPGRAAPADTSRPRRQTMKWVTRARPKTDRIACPWLIRRFIDPDAEILYVPNDEVLAVAADQGAHSFDAPGATLRPPRRQVHLRGPHRRLRPRRRPRAGAAGRASCTPPTSTPSSHTDPFGPALLAIGARRPRRRSRRPPPAGAGLFVYDALYAWCRQQVAAGAA